MTCDLFAYVKGRGVLPERPEVFQFPGGEWHLRNLPGHADVHSGDRIFYVADVRGADPNDLIKAGLWADVAHRANFNFTSMGRQDFMFVLLLPYLPAARADRAIPLGSAVYSRQIRALTPWKVIAMDPHSEEMAGQLRPYIKLADQNVAIKEAIDGIGFDAIICPDQGARDRATRTAEALGLDVHYAEKRRDFQTGKLSGFKAPATLRGCKGRFLVVDDICDGGGTFMGLADALGVDRDSLGLWVTHGIFSGHADRLREKFRWIATTDSHPGARRPGVATYVHPIANQLIDSI